jgi:predicted RNase H-like nuclease (RuvC/YqgF family)
MRPKSPELPLYGTTAADAEGLTPEAYQASLGAARLEKFITMYRLLAQTESHVRDVESRLAAYEPASARMPGEVTEFGEGTVAHARGGAAPPIPPPSPGGLATMVVSDDQQLVASALRDELIAERQKRDELQAELTRLRAETSSGPFERGDNAALQSADAEIATLKNALRQEGRERDEMRQQYDALRAKVRSEGGSAAAIEENAGLREQITKLKVEQQQQVDSLRRDLEASQQREQELKTTLASAQETRTTASTGEVVELKAQNDTLRVQIAEERQRSQDLETKLKAAMRVSDLIFRMEKQEGQAP